MRSIHLAQRVLVFVVAAGTLLSARQLSAQPTGGDPFAQPQAQRGGADRQMVLRVYEVADLVVHVPDYVYSQGAENTLGRVTSGFAGSGMGGGMGRIGGTGGMSGMMVPSGGPGGLPAGDAYDAANRPGFTLPDLVRAITTVCGAESWSEVGGPGSIEILGLTLLVRQTDDVHKQIQDLLNQLRKGSGRRTTVSIDARWLVLNSDDLERLAPRDQQGEVQVDESVLDEFTRRPTSIRAMTKCFSGQLVYLVSGTRQSIVTSVIPVVGSIESPRESELEYADRAAGNPFIFVALQEVGATPSTNRNVGYQPVVETCNFGASLEIRPQLVPDANAAIIDLRSTITAPAKPMASLAAPPAQVDGAPQVDRIAIDTQELATTLSVPLSQPVLIGGLTRVASSTLEAPASEAASAPAPAASQETPQLYLIVELRTEAIGNQEAAPTPQSEGK